MMSLATSAPVTISADESIASATGRSRLSGAALRIFTAIAKKWQMSVDDQIALLGYHGRSTHHKWLADAAAHRKVTLPYDTLMRVSAIIGIDKAYSILAAEDDMGSPAWLRHPRPEWPFSGSPPLAIMRQGLDSLIAVRRYLDGARGGRWLAPEIRTDAGIPERLPQGSIRFIN